MLRPAESVLDSITEMPVPGAQNECLPTEVESKEERQYAVIVCVVDLNNECTKGCSTCTYNLIPFVSIRVSAAAAFFICLFV